MHFERRLAGPDEPIERIRLRAARAPAAIGAADEQRAIGRKLQRQRPAAKAAAERKAGPLVVAVHFFQKHPHHRAVRLVADEQLLAKRPEFAARKIAGDARGRLAHLAIREIDGRRLELRESSSASTIIRLPLCGSAGCSPIDAAGCRVPFVADGMAEKRAGPQPLEAARAVPGSLIVGIEHVARGVRADAAGRAKAAARRESFCHRA